MQKSCCRMPSTHPGLCHVAHTTSLLAAYLLLLSACGGVQFTNDALIRHLPPGQDQVCRDAVRNQLAQHNVSPDWVRRIHYQARVSTRGRVGDRIVGFDAWVYPKNGNGALVIELSESCQVQRMWAHGTR